MTEDQLEIKLRHNVKSMINRKWHEYKTNKSKDPGTLRNRIKMLESGLHDLRSNECNEDEVSDMKHIIPEDY